MFKHLILFLSVSFPSAIAYCAENTSIDDKPTDTLLPNLSFMNEQTIHLFITLMIVLVLVFISIYLMKKLGASRWNNKGVLKIVSQMSINNKDRLVLIEAGNKQILLGVTSTAINTLHVFDEKIINTEKKSNYKNDDRTDPLFSEPNKDFFPRKNQ
jgi:flagellar biosynthetic protein FliO